MTSVNVCPYDFLLWICLTAICIKYKVLTHSVQWIVQFTCGLCGKSVSSVIWRFILQILFNNLFFSSALEKVATVVNYLFHATPVIYFPDLNHASLLLIPNLMYSYIWIMCFFPVLSVLKLIYMHFETRGTTTTSSSNKNPCSSIMLVSVSLSPPTPYSC